MATKIADVAARAGVSTATVSRVLSGKPHVSDAMRARVMSAVEELAYRPSRVARSLRARRANILGLIVSDIQNPFFTAIVRGIEDSAYQRRFGVFLCNSDESPDKEALYIDLMLAEQVSGVIISPTVDGAPFYQRLLDARVPIVAFDRFLVGMAVDTVVIDNVSVARRLVEGLIANGHRRIAAVVGSEMATTGSERRQGYEQAVQIHGMPLDEGLIRVGNPRQADGYRATQELLALADPPTAIFTGNNLLTVGVLQALHEHHRIRGDHRIEVAAIDELDWMRVVDIPLSVAAQPTYEMGRTAAELLFDRMDDFDRSPQKIVLPAQVHIQRTAIQTLEV
jgi:LacI family transcriptional regulator